MDITYKQMNPKGLYICKFPEDNIYYLFYFISLDEKISKIRGSWVKIDVGTINIGNYKKLVTPSNCITLFSHYLTTAEYIKINNGLAQLDTREINEH
jgi:hypothetical protein